MWEFAQKNKTNSSFIFQQDVYWFPDFLTALPSPRWVFLPTVPVHLLVPLHSAFCFYSSLLLLAHSLNLFFWYWLEFKLDRAQSICVNCSQLVHTKLVAHADCSRSQSYPKPIQIPLQTSIHLNRQHELPLKDASAFSVWALSPH